MAQLSASVCLATALALSSGCTPDKKVTRKSPPTGEPAAEQKPLPPLGEAQPCALEPERAGPLRRAGTADIELSGSGGTLSVKGARALCGPMYDRDSDVLQVKAGDGLLFEVCVPEGLVSVSSFKRATGKQPIRDLDQPDGAEASFQRFKGATFSSRGGDPTDNITFGDDFWSATAKVHMKSESDQEEMSGTIRFACPIPNPAALSAQSTQTDALKP